MIRRTDKRQQKQRCSKINKDDDKDNEAVASNKIIIYIYPAAIYIV